MPGTHLLNGHMVIHRRITLRNVILKGDGPKISILTLSRPASGFVNRTIDRNAFQTSGMLCTELSERLVQDNFISDEARLCGNPKRARCKDE